MMKMEMKIKNSFSKNYLLNPINKKIITHNNLLINLFINNTKVIPDIKTEKREYQNLMLKIIIKTIMKIISVLNLQIRA